MNYIGSADIKLSFEMLLWNYGERIITTTIHHKHLKLNLKKGIAISEMDGMEISVWNDSMSSEHRSAPILHSTPFFPCRLSKISNLVCLYTYLNEFSFPQYI